MKKVVLSFATCLTLLAASAWLIATPALAGSITMSCYGGGSVSCSGSSCYGADGTSDSKGWCQCTSSNGSYDIKTCPTKDGPAMEEGPVS